MRGFHGHRQDLLAASALDVPRDAGQRAARADPADEHVDLAFGVLPDLRSRGLLVDSRIGGIFELLRQQEFAGVRGGQFFRLGNRPLHALGTRGQNQLGAECSQYLAPLHGHGLGHGQNASIAARGRGIGERNAGIAAGGFDDGHSRFQGAALFGVPHHGRADAALHRVGWIAALDLGKDGRAAARVEAVDSDQRRAADGFRVVLVNRHRSPLGLAPDFPPKRGGNAIEVCYETLPRGYKPRLDGPAYIGLGTIDRGSGRPTTNPCTKSIPMPVTVSRDSWSSTCSATTRKLRLRDNSIIGATMSRFTVSPARLLMKEPSILR